MMATLLSSFTTFGAINTLCQILFYLNIDLETRRQRQRWYDETKVRTHLIHTLKAVVELNCTVLCPLLNLHSPLIAKWQDYRVVY